MGPLLREGRGGRTVGKGREEEGKRTVEKARKGKGKSEKEGKAWEGKGGARAPQFQICHNTTGLVMTVTFDLDL